ncbi:MAG: carbohydrate-binding family 9-like protein [Muribaculaceae bacterium]|nr:carbohydrate-binding family 9-like protein [Muribaculaceae bacterium]
MNVKSIEVERVDSLDSMSLEDVSEYLEQNSEKHSIECRNWADEFPYHPITAFAMAYSSRYLYVDFFVRGNYLRAVNWENNSPVYEDSCVEFFVKHPEDKEYWNFEFNCIGTINASRRLNREQHTKLSDDVLDSIRRYASCGNRPFEEMEGLFPWSLTVAIPLDVINVDINNAPVRLKGNLYKCGDKTSLPHFLSWAPIDAPKPDFHRPEFFGDIILK